MRSISIPPSADTIIAGACDQPERSAILIQNDGDTDIFLRFDGSAAVLTADNGFRLRAGEHISLESTEKVSFANNEISAFHTGTGDKVLRIQEFAEDGRTVVS